MSYRLYLWVLASAAQAHHGAKRFGQGMSGVGLGLRVALHDMDAGSIHETPGLFTHSNFDDIQFLYEFLILHKCKTKNNIQIRYEEIY